MTQGTSYTFPLTQNDLAEATGLTSIDVKRTLQEMRAAGMIVLKDRTLDIPSLDALEEVVLFPSDHLHLDQEGAGVQSQSAGIAHPRLSHDGGHDGRRGRARAGVAGTGRSTSSSA